MLLLGKDIPQPKFLKYLGSSQGCNQLRVQTSWNLYVAGLYVPFHTNLVPKTILHFSLEKAA